ncbi:hypothetical protein RW26_02550 [Aeromonas sp. L_1B5_3]|nr:hypothetical protein RW26_02550 [Aeromonas sp. L_1B5_3]
MVLLWIHYVWSDMAIKKFKWLMYIKITLRNLMFILVGRLLGNLVTLDMLLCLHLAGGRQQFF